MKRLPIDPELIRDRLSVAQGKQYWRSLEELAGEPGFQEMLRREFPDQASQWHDPLSRRRFLTLMGASLAMAGLAGCRPPAGTILPYVRQPENLVLGKPLYYATTMPLSGFGTGLLVESHEGRPTKIEGNPLHPASLGATSPQQQAAILGLYDPDRSQTVTYRGQPRSWEDVLADLRNRLHPRSGRGEGKGVAVLSEAIGSPTLIHARNAFLSAYPQARWYFYEPINRDNAVAGARMAFGKPLHSYCKVEKADVVVSFDADYLALGPAHLASTREHSRRRREAGGKAGMNRLYVLETNLTVTGAAADHRLAVKPSEIEDLARALAAKLGVAGVQAPTLSEERTRWIDAVARDLQTRQGKPRPAGTTLALAGDGQPPAVHALVHAINDRLGNIDATVFLTDVLPGELSPSVKSLTRLHDAIEAGEIDTLLILGGNPAYTAPADIPLANLLTRQLATKKKDQWLAIHMGGYFDETARLCHWHLPQTHFLEEWGDAVAFDGTASIIQPLVAPLYAGKSAIELLAAITPADPTFGEFDDRTAHDLVRTYWKSNRPAASTGESFDVFWSKALHDGVLPGTAWPTQRVAVEADLGAALAPRLKEGRQGFELVFAPDPTLYDGRFANNGWLQEMPKPITELTWDNALIIGPKTAEALKVSSTPSQWIAGEHGRSIATLVRIRHGRRMLEAAVWVLPGHAEGAATLHLGYGRTKAGRAGSRTGFDAGKLRLSTDAWFLPGVQIDRLDRTYVLACVQAHHSMEGRDIVRSGTLAEYQKDPHFAQKEGHAPAEAGKKEGGNHARTALPTLYPDDHKYTGYRWGMAVDLSACTGCGACVVACQAENNSPVVGKEEVARGREMHWLRIDRYFETPKDSPDPGSDLRVHLQPVMCQHCENAPCELVCPVEATVHGDEGTNDMVYNRCVGTRYCANNCPYKVRRFNFFPFSDYDTPSLRLMYNPDVTVRTRGVMEKCTFCIQRVSYARIEAAREAMNEQHLPLDQQKRRDAQGADGKPRTDQGREIPYIRDGEVVSACQSACPAEAIVFGDLNDRTSRVHKLQESSLRYDLLGELGVRPRVAYLAALRNPNPELEGK